MGVVREDVVKMGFDIDFGELTRLTSALDDIKTILTSGIGGDAFDEMTRDSRRAADSIDDIRDGLNGIRPDGIEDTVNGLKDTEKEGEDAYGKLKKIANTSFDKTVSGLNSIVKTLGKVGIAAGKLLAKGLVAGVAGVGAIVGSAIMSYADYEQLVGGVETLFKDSSGTVQKYADEAYRTAGMSANDYMSTVTSFSASLIQGLGGNTGAAAEYANMAIIDMADNANKMGTDIGMIQDAYQGFAKDNYTMLDNLKLGYGGTAGEMARLINDSGVLGDSVKVTAETVNDVPFDKIIEAIHKTQENLGITGTTAAEASDTISGSFASMKAAWGNTLTSLILGGDDFDRCVDNLVESAKTFGKNIMPALIKGLEGAGRLIEELAPIIEKELPTLIDTLLPPLIKAAGSLLKGVIIALPDIISTIIDEIPGILKQVWEGIREAVGDVPGMDKVEGFFGKLITFFTENADTIKKVVPALIGLVAAFKLFNKIKGLTSLFGGKGGKGGDSEGFFKSLASMKPTTVLKGMGNLAIIIGGLAILAAALMFVAPYMAQLSDWQSITEVLIVITAVGLIGTALAKMAGMVGNIPVATVAKGVANIAIALVAMGALTAVLMWLAPYISQLSDMQTTMEILVIIGAVGLVGSALAGLAGLIGMIPIPAVLAGLANIALALGGFTLIVAAFSALAMIPGFNDFLSRGGEVLANLCRILGEMVGSLIGGIGEGISDSLPAIAENLSKFATSLQPMLDTFSGVDASGLGDFAGALAAFIAVIAGEKIVSVITGGIDYTELGNKLSTMATSLSGFFTTIMTFPEGGFEKATALFNCLAGISSLPKEGGVVGWFQGEVDFATMATGLNMLAGTVGFFTAIMAIPEEAFAKAGQLFDCLAGIKSLPKEGGVVGWFTGEVDFTTITTGIQQLGSAGFIAALMTISTIPETAFTSLTSMFNTLAGVKAMPKEGGVAGWFAGDNSTALSNVASQLPGLATNIATFFSNLGGRTDFTPIKSLFDTLGSINISSDAADKGFLGLGQSKLEELGTGLSNFATNASTFFTKINSLNAANITSFFSALSTAGDLPDSLSSLDDTVGTALSNIVTTAETKLTELKNKITSSLNSIITLVAAAATGMYNSGVSMMDGLNNGMESMRATLIATATSIATAVQAAYDAQLDINSPSRVMETSGEDTVMGGVIGMRNRIPDMRAAATDVADAAVPTYTRTYSPDTDGGTVYNNRTSSEERTIISPSFELNISGTQDDRAMARKVKQWVAQAIQETFESWDRQTPVTREA